MTGSGLLTLIFPQWQGTGNRKDVYYGAMLIKDRLLADRVSVCVPVSLDEKIQAEHGINGYRQICDQLKSASSIIEEKRPEKIFLIGGDCGTDVAPIAYLNKRYSRDLAVIWMDAHGDINSPETSVSQNFHGMPLRFLLGDCMESLVPVESVLKPSQVIYAGIRETDPPEAEFIAEKCITCATVSDIRDDRASVIRMIEQKGFHNIYIHVDLDVLDPEKCFSLLCPSENGLDEKELRSFLSEVKRRFNVVGMSIVELRPVEDTDLTPIRELVRYGNSL